MPQRWKNRPDGSNWGEFGPDDRLGRLNLLTPDKVKQGIAEVRDGKTFCLCLPLAYPGGNKLNPRRYPPRLNATERVRLIIALVMPGGRYEASERSESEIVERIDYLTEMAEASGGLFVNVAEYE